MDILDQAKQVKHQLFLASKWVSRKREDLTDIGFRATSRLRPHKYTEQRYPLDFVSLAVPERLGSIQAVAPRRIWCVWAGDNEMSKNRRAALESIRSTNGHLDVTLVTPENLDDYVVPGSPLHPSYAHLSDVHKSDYLHAYLMHHHGGGFTDIKKHPHEWTQAFEQSEADPDAWVIGYRIQRSAEATYFDGPLCRDIRRNYASLIGFSGKVVRANSPITHEWLLEVERRLDYYSSLLVLAPGDAYGTNSNYPVPWTRIGSQVFEPLCLKYRQHIRINDILKPQLWGHR